MVNVASLEDLIVMKILSGRPKDLEDVETLLAIRRDDVSIRVVQATLRQAEKLLDQSDLSPVFRQLLTAVPKARQAKAPARSRMKGRAVRERRRK
jgi:hypothetical protein